jgi:nitrogen regulatory protein PII-like uncharacterized protein
MTQGAIFGYRGVFPQEWAAFLLVTAETVFVERNLVQARLAQAAVRVVAVGAGGLTFRNGVARG